MYFVSSAIACGRPQRYGFGNLEFSLPREYITGALRRANRLFWEEESGPLNHMWNIREEERVDGT